MSTSIPNPGAQVAALNDRILSLKTLILDYRKLVERTVLPIAHATIAYANRMETEAEERPDEAIEKKTALEAVAGSMKRRSHSNALLALFEEQMEKLEKFQKEQLDDVSATDEGYESLKEESAPDVFVLMDRLFVMKLRSFGKEVFDTLIESDHVKAQQVLDGNEVWKKILAREYQPGFATEFIELVARWSRVNP